MNREFIHELGNAFIQHMTGCIKTNIRTSRYRGISPLRWKLAVDGDPDMLAELVYFWYNEHRREIAELKEYTAQLEKKLGITDSKIKVKSDSLLDTDRLQAERLKELKNSRKIDISNNIRKEDVIDAIIACKGNKTMAAKLLGISINTLYRRLE